MRDLWPYDRFRLALVEEKLYGDPSGEEATAFGIDGDGGIVAFVAVAFAPSAGKCWVKLGAIAMAVRGRGCLHALLSHAERWARARGARAMRLMDHPGNYWTPGGDVRYAEALEALGHMGWSFAGENRSLACPTRPRGSAPALPAGVSLRRATAADADAVIALATRFLPAWGWELRRALACRPSAVHLAVAGDRLLAFAAHDGNNRGTGSFGPAATLRAWRGKGLGELLLRACLRDTATAPGGRPRRLVTIPWVSTTTMYARVGAYEFGRYRVLEKSLL